MSTANSDLFAGNLMNDHRIIHDSNSTALSQLHDEGVKVDLCYMDPPFMTGQDFFMADGRLAYRDRFSSLGQYISHLRETVSLVWKILAPHGCVVVHIDSRTSHYVKVMCDDVFGAHNFSSEIVWRYRRWPSKTRNFQRVHDTILRYVKDSSTECRWNQMYDPLAESTKKVWGTKKQTAVIRDGCRVRSSTSVEESLGVPAGDVWDIGIIAPSSTERTGYPTQKPLALLERIVASMSYKGDVVLDPYMGSGTTLVAAKSIGRKSIGIDSSDVAVSIANSRLGG